MTEQEAIKRIRYRIETASDIAGRGVDGKAFEDLEIAIKILEEIQQYWAMGTVEELKRMEEEWLYSVSDMVELRVYRNLGTVKELREAREKQVPKKINIVPSREKEIKDGVYVFYQCPECGHKISSGFYYPLHNKFLKRHEFCESCGQAIDWLEEEITSKNY